MCHTEAGAGEAAAPDSELGAPPGDPSSPSHSFPCLHCVSGSIKQNMQPWFCPRREAVSLTLKSRPLGSGRCSPGSGAGVKESGELHPPGSGDRVGDDVCLLSQSCQRLSY